MSVGICSGTATVLNPLSASASCTGCGSRGFCCCWGARRTTVVSMLTRVSLGAAWRVAYTTPAMIALLIASDANPTRNNLVLLVFRLDSRSVRTTDPPPVRKHIGYRAATSGAESRGTACPGLPHVRRGGAIEGCARSVRGPSGGLDAGRLLWKHEVRDAPR